MSRSTPPTGVVVAWMPVSQRSTTLAARLGFEVLLVGRTGFRSPWTAPLAYPVSAWRTVSQIARRRPRAVIVVAPPIVAPLLLVPIYRALGRPVAIDIHSGAMLDRRWRWSIPILHVLGRMATASIVTLDTLAAPLREQGVTTHVIADPLPRLAAQPSQPPVGDHGRPVVVAVCGWGDDEPLEALVAAASGARWSLVVTGRPRRELVTTDNVRLTGFLDDPEYVELLRTADLILVLTTREDTLLSGAWEALALGRPLLVSSTRALVATFGSDVARVEPDPASIAAAVDAVLADADAASRSRALAERHTATNDAALDELADRLEGQRRG